MSKKIIILVFLVQIVFNNSCVQKDVSETREKVEELENKVSDLEDRIGILESDNEPSESINHRSVQPVDKPIEIQSFVFAKFIVNSTAMSGLNEYSSYTDVGVSNVLSVNNFTEDLAYKLKDETKRQPVTLSRPFASGVKISEVEILQFNSYAEASKQRESINAAVEVRINVPFN